MTSAKNLRAANCVFRRPVRLHRRSSSAWIIHDVLPFAGIRTRHDRNDGFRVAQVADLVRNSGLDKDEIARRIVHRTLESFSELMPYATLEDVKHHLEVHVNVGIRHAAGWNRRDVHRELPSSNVSS